MDKINDSSKFPLSKATIKKYFNCTDSWEVSNTFPDWSYLIQEFAKQQQNTGNAQNVWLGFMSILGSQIMKIYV